MNTLYLGFNAIMYACFAIWCALAPDKTSRYVGLAAIDTGGRSEYLAIYGGLQAGLAVFYGLSIWMPEHRRAAILLSAVLYGGIVAFRSIAVARLGFGELGNARLFYVLEIALFVAALVLMVRRAA